MQIKKLLDTIDENKNLDRSEIILDLILIILFKTFTKGSTLLGQQERDKLYIYLADRETLHFREMYKLFEYAGKSHSIQQIANDVSEQVTADYINTQLKSFHHQDKGKNSV